MISVGPNWGLNPRPHTVFDIKPKACILPLNYPALMKGKCLFDYTKELVKPSSDSQSTSVAVSYGGATCMSILFATFDFVKKSQDTIKQIKERQFQDFLWVMMVLAFSEINQSTSPRQTPPAERHSKRYPIPPKNFYSISSDLTNTQAYKGNRDQKKSNNLSLFFTDVRTIFPIS